MATESLFKMMKNSFYFTLKALLALKTLNFSLKDNFDFLDQICSKKHSRSKILSNSDHLISLSNKFHFKQTSLSFWTKLLKNDLVDQNQKNWESNSANFSTNFTWIGNFEFSDKILPKKVISRLKKKTWTLPSNLAHSI